MQNCYGRGQWRKVMTILHINVREHRRGSQKWTIQKNWQHRVHKTKKNTIRVGTPLYANKHK